MEIPGYKLGRVVDTGKVCTSYSALDIQRSKTVVVKVFNEMLSGNEAFQLHFKKVTRTLFNKSLGNNIQLIDAACSSKSCLMVTNYCSGISLRHGRIPAFTKEKVIGIGRQIAVSLSQLHDLDIVHGGVELSNINFLDDGEAILGTVAVHRTMPGNGLTHFALENIQDVVSLAPEASDGLTASTDFYALGVLLYELLTGKKPFNTDRITDLEQQKSSGDYRPLEGTLADLKPLFDSLLSPEPEFRIMSDKEFDSVLKVYRIDAAVNNISASVEKYEKKSAGKSAIPAVSTLINNIPRPSRVLSAIAAVVVCSAVIIMLFPESNQTPQAIVQLNSSITTSRPDVVIKAPVIIRQSNDEINEDGLFATASALVDAGDYEAALKLVDAAAVTELNETAAEELKNKIEHELRIESFITLAEQQFLDDKIIMPPGDNAFETYQRIANLAPEGDQRAQSGLEKIAGHYFQIAIDQLDNNNLEAAKKAVIQGLMVNSDYTALLELKSRLTGENQIQHENKFLPNVEHSTLVKARSPNNTPEQMNAVEQARPIRNYGRIERQTGDRSEVASQ